MLTLSPNQSKPLYWKAQRSCRLLPSCPFLQSFISCRTGWDHSFGCYRLIFDCVFHSYGSLVTWLMPVYSELRITELIPGSHSLFFTRETNRDQKDFLPLCFGDQHYKAQGTEATNDQSKKGTAKVGSYSKTHTDKFCWSMQLSPISIKPTFLLVLIPGSKGSKDIFLQTGIIKDLHTSTVTKDVTQPYSMREDPRFMFCGFGFHCLLQWIC